MTDTSWFPDAPPFPGVPAWQYSGNSGGSWANYAGTALGQIAGATGTQRFRRQFTVPVGAPSRMTVRWQGDLYDSSVNQPSQLRLDGVQVGSGVLSSVAFATVTFPTPAAGAHTLEIWVGAADDGGITQLLAVDVEVANPVPCDCCTIGQACARTQILFDEGPAVLVSQGSATGVYPLDRWSNGDISGPNFAGFNSPGVDFTAATSPVIDLSFLTPQNRLVGLREWNQGGGDLGDGDGFASWDYTLFDAANVVLATGNMVMGNGGAPFTHLFPSEVSGVKRMRLDNMRKVNPGSGVAPLVREVQALQIGTVFSCRRPSGALEWYDVAGNLVPSADVVTCS